MDEAPELAPEVAALPPADKSPKAFSTAKLRAEEALRLMAEAGSNTSELEACNKSAEPRMEDSD